MYRISKVILIREKEGNHFTQWGFEVDHTTKELEKYRESVKQKYHATKVVLIYEEDK